MLNDISRSAVLNIAGKVYKDDHNKLVVQDLMSVTVEVLGHEIDITEAVLLNLNASRAVQDELLVDARQALRKATAEQQIKLVGLVGF